MQSCRGLYLCWGRLFDRGSFRRREHYIYNPITNQLAILPKFNDATFCSNVVLAFDPSNSPHYKVIACVRISQMRFPDLSEFQIYSSETRTWRTVFVQAVSEPPDVNMLSGVYCNGCIHRLGKSGADSLYFNVDEERLGTFPGPPIDPNSTSRRSLYFGESEDHLHVIEIFPSATSLDLYEMKSDHSGWFLKYHVDLAQVFIVFPQTGNDLHLLDLIYPRIDNMFQILSLVRKDRYQEDSFLILELPGRAIRYNLADGSFKQIWDYAKLETSILKLNCGMLQAWPYIESLSPV